MGISLALLAAWAASGLAADPPAMPAQTRWNAPPPVAQPPSLPPVPNVLPKFIPAPPPPPNTPAPDQSRMVLFQKPAEPPAQQKKPSIAPLPSPAPAPVPGPTTQPPPAPAPAPQLGKDTFKMLDDAALLTRPPAALQRDKVFQQLNSDEQLRLRVIGELAKEQYDRDLRDWESKAKLKDPTLGPKPTLERVQARLKYPETPPPGKVGEPYVTKVIRESYPPSRLAIEPAYVVHRKLLFEEQNAERFGWDAGIVQPAISTAYFYKDILLWPAKLASYPFERYDTSAGKCLPGNPVPYYLYPEEISLFGATVGAGAIIGTTAFMFP